MIASIALLLCILAAGGSYLIGASVLIWLAGLWLLCLCANFVFMFIGRDLATDSNSNEE